MTTKAKMGRPVKVPAAIHDSRVMIRFQPAAYRKVAAASMLAGKRLAVWARDVLERESAKAAK